MLPWHLPCCSSARARTHTHTLYFTLRIYFAPANLVHLIPNIYAILGKNTTQTWMIDVRPWFDFPRPIPSCQPIFWSNLLPTLSDPIPDFVGSSYEIEAASSLVLRYFSCKHYQHHTSSNTLLSVNGRATAELWSFNGNKIQQNLLRLTTTSRSSNTPVVQSMNPSLRCWCAWTKWHGSQPKNIKLKTLKHTTVDGVRIEVMCTLNVSCSTHTQQAHFTLHAPMYNIYMQSGIL